MISGDIETTEKVEYEDLLKNYYEKMEIIEEQDKKIESLKGALQTYEILLKSNVLEIERLNNIVNELKKYIEDTKQDGYKLVWINKENSYFEAGIEEILGDDK